MMSSGQYAVGIIQHPETRRWQPYVFTTHEMRDELFFLSAHDDRDSAAFVAQTYSNGWLQYQTGHSQLMQRVAATIQAGHPPDPLPADAERELIALIHGHIQARMILGER
jgi:hypothetical protein